VNLEGRWQSAAGATKPFGDSRPAWKVLRVLGNLLNLPSFDYVSADEITHDERKQVDEASAAAPKSSGRVLQSKPAAAVPNALRDIPIYQVDAVVRRSAALQSTPEAQRTTQKPTGASARGQGE
jgi:NADH-quinone oxidoreductase subunit G